MHATHGKCLNRIINAERHWPWFDPLWIYSTTIEAQQYICWFILTNTWTIEMPWLKLVSYVFLWPIVSVQLSFPVDSIWWYFECELVLIMIFFSISSWCSVSLWRCLSEESWVTRSVPTWKCRCAHACTPRWANTAMSEPSPTLGTSHRRRYFN